MLPARRHLPSVTLFVVTTIALLAFDLWTKTASFERIAHAPVTILSEETGRPMPVPPHEPTIVVPKILALHLTLNEGAVFGLGHGGRWVFIVFSVIAAAVLSVVFARSEARRPVLHVALGAVLAGALGNLYDRIVYAAVRDMLLLFPGVRLPFGWSWPDGSTGLYPWIFNVADVCLVCGLVVLMVMVYRTEKA